MALLKAASVMLAAAVVEEGQGRCVDAIDEMGGMLI